MERSVNRPGMSALGILFCCLLCSGARGEKPAYSVAVLDCSEWKHPGSSSPEVLADAFRSGGFETRLISTHDLEDPQTFNAQVFSLVVFPYGELFPAEARQNFLRFLGEGGDFISMGGYAFRRPVMKLRGEWLSVRDFVRQMRIHVLDIGSETDEIFLSGDWYEAEKTADGGAFRWTGKSAAAFLNPPEEVPWRVVVEGTIREEVRDLRREVWWKGKRIGQLAGSNLHRWEFDMPLIPAGEESSGDLRFECETWRPAEVLGTQDERALGVAIDSIKVFRANEPEPIAAAPLHEFARPINTSDGPARDFLEVLGEQIGVFDAGYPLRQAASAQSAAEQNILRRSIKVRGPFLGYAATGMIGSHWYCDSPRDEGRLVPLIRAYDRYGRFRGNIGAAILNHSDAYRGSLWAFFGVDNGDLFRRDIPGTLGALSDVASFFERGIFLHETRPEFACYSPEENYRILTNISNLSEVTQTVQIDFETFGDASEPIDRESQRLLVAPGSVTAATFVSRIQKTGSSFYRVRVALSLEGRRIDCQDSGFFVWRPEEIGPSAFPLTWTSGRLGAGEVPLFLLGTQAFYPMYSVEDRSPARVLEDFQLMRDFGVGIARHFSWGREKHHTRFRDALVVAAQREGIVSFVEGLADRPTEAPGLLEAARSAAGAVADRYRTCPGLMIDVGNEPVFRKEDLKTLAPAYARYIGASTENVIEEIPFRGEWDDTLVVESHRFLTSVMRNWLHTCASAVHEASPGRLITVGHLQFVNQQPVDRRASIDDLDFVNQHFYADAEDIRRLSAEMLFLDMAYARRPTSLGEFGSKTHPAFGKTGHNYDTEEEQLLRYAHTVHMAFGLRTLFACNWHWRDPVSCVFPYGLLYQDGVPKKTAKLYRAMSLLFAGPHPAPATPEVYVLIPEAHRTGSAWAKATWATLASIGRLLDCQVPVGVIHESDLSLLPKEVSVLFWPVPYCPKDEVYFRVVDFVRNGGNLYVSGDISYEEKTRRRTRTARLVELCGAEFVEQRYPNIRFRKASPVRTVAATDEIEISVGVAYPALVVQAGRAKPLFLSETGDPVVLLHRLGRGRVLYNVDPVELRWNCDESATQADTELYRWFLRRCGVVPLPVEPKVADFRAMRVPTRERGEVYVFVDLAAERSLQTARLRGPREELSITLTDHFPGVIHLDRQGRAIAVESGGELRAAGEPVVEANVPFMLISLDGADVRVSKMLVVVPFERGSLRIRSNTDWEEPILQVGEVRNRRWQPFESISLRADAGGAFQFQVHNLQEFETLIICEKGGEAECGDRVVERLLKPWQTH